MLAPEMFATPPVVLVSDTLYDARAEAGKHIPAAATTSTASKRLLMNRVAPAWRSCPHGAESVPIVVLSLSG